VDVVFALDDEEGLVELFFVIIHLFEELELDIFDLQYQYLYDYEVLVQQVLREKMVEILYLEMILHIDEVDEVDLQDVQLVEVVDDEEVVTVIDEREFSDVIDEKQSQIIEWRDEVDD
jgi:hypothetical protein